MKLRIKKLVENAVVPEYKSSGAACFDLTITSIKEIGDHFWQVGFGISSEMEEGWKLVFVPRSSFTGYNFTLQNSPGQIDSDYRGEWMVKIRGLVNEMLDYDEFPFKVGDRCIQAYPERVERAEFEVVEELSTTERGEGGFGSTNK